MDCVYLARMKNTNKVYKWIIGIVILLAIAASIQSYLLPKKGVEHNDILYFEYNNYMIFKYSFFHLIDNTNLYVDYPEECYDLFKYTPSFALFMGLFAFLPDILGLILWNLLNALVLVSAIRYLPFDNGKKNMLMLAYIGIEMITNLQNAQSNALIAGLLIWAFNSAEKKHFLRATLLLGISVFIKLFGLLGFALFIFYPSRLRSAIYSLGWMILLFLIPLFVIGFSDLIHQYGNYIHMLRNDHSTSIGLSIMGWLETWFGLTSIKSWILIPGILLLLLPLVRIKHYSSISFRLLYLANLLIWIVIFNHKAESPTFIIAISGVAIWYFAQPSSKVNLALLVLAFVFTSLSPTDLFPRSFKENWVVPYVLKAVPCILIWFKLSYDLLLKKEFILTAKEI